MRPCRMARSTVSCSRAPSSVPCRARQRLLLGLDCSPIRRPDAVTARDRTLVYWPNLPKDATPVVPGWSFSALVVLPQSVSSWTYVLDHQRVASSATAVSYGAQQLTLVVPLLPNRAVLLCCSTATTPKRPGCWPPPT